LSEGPRDPEPPDDEARPPAPWYSREAGHGPWIGIGLSLVPLALVLAFQLLSAVSSLVSRGGTDEPLVLLIIGVLGSVWVLQLIYIPIAAIIALIAKRSDVVTGLVIGFAAAFFLIPATCFGLWAVGNTG
jgi:hypothetical protein